MERYVINVYFIGKKYPLYWRAASPEFLLELEELILKGKPFRCPGQTKGTLVINPHNVAYLDSERYTKEEED